MDQFVESRILRTALVRAPGVNCGQGLTKAGRGAPDPDLLFRQHENYVAALTGLGLEIIRLPAEKAFPDAYFVEDTAVITPYEAVITRPGAPSRRGEEDSIAAVLGRRLPLDRIVAPGTLDGGDVLEAGGFWFIGLSERTNEDGARQLGRVLESHGLPWSPVRVGAGLHLKSGVNDLGHGAIIVTRILASDAAFRPFRRIILDPDEAEAANVLSINGRLLLPAGFPSVRRRLEALGRPVLELDVSEVRKMDGGLTCMSIRF